MTSQQTRCLEKIEQAFQKAEQTYGVKLARVPVKFNGRLTSTAGRVLYTDRATPQVIELSSKLLELNGETFINDTPGHEAAHAIATLLFREDGFGHGRHWKQVMSVIGQEATRTHSMKVANRISIKCSCKTHQITKVTYKKMQAGSKFLCNNCGDVLRCKE